MPPTKLTLLIAQIFISLMMAFLMTGILTAIPTTLAPGWVAIWMGRFVVSWPIAFILSLAVGPVAFWLAGLVMRSFGRLGLRVGV